VAEKPCGITNLRNGFNEAMNLAQNLISYSLSDACWPTKRPTRWCHSSTCLHSHLGSISWWEQKKVPYHTAWRILCLFLLQFGCC